VDRDDWAVSRECVGVANGTRASSISALDLVSPGYSDFASGVAYHWDTDTLFIIGDGGISVTEATKTGALVSTMTLPPGGSSSPQRGRHQRRDVLRLAPDHRRGRQEVLPDGCDGSALSGFRNSSHD
jgi:hypothetical protein